MAKKLENRHSEAGEVRRHMECAVCCRSAAGPFYGSQGAYPSQG